MLSPMSSEVVSTVENLAPNWLASAPEEIRGLPGVGAETPGVFREGQYLHGAAAIGEKIKGLKSTH